MAASRSRSVTSSQRRFAICVLTAAVLCAASPALGFDGDRMGFVLGVGLGFGQASWDVDSPGMELLNQVEPVDESGVAADLRLGVGLSEQLQIAAVANGVVFTAGAGDFLQSFYGLGVSYFLRPSAPSLFCGGYLGLGHVISGNGEDDRESGGAFQLSAGFELLPGLALELQYMRANIADTGLQSWRAENVIATIRWVFY